MYRSACLIITRAVPNSPALLRQLRRSGVKTQVRCASPPGISPGCERTISETNSLARDQTSGHYPDPPRRKCLKNEHRKEFRTSLEPGETPPKCPQRQRPSMPDSYRATKNFNSHAESLQSTPVRSSLFHNIPRGLSRPFMRVDLRAAAAFLQPVPRTHLPMEVLSILSAQCPEVRVRYLLPPSSDLQHPLGHPVPQGGDRIAVTETGEYANSEIPARFPSRFSIRYSQFGCIA